MTRIPYPHRPALLIITAMVALLVTLAVPKPLTAQTTQPAIDDTTSRSETPPPGSEPQRTRPEPAPDKSGIDTTTDVEIQRRFNELQREFLDDRSEFLDNRAKDVDWWLAAIVIFLTFFAIVVAIIGYFGFQRFREIEKEARQNVEALKEQEKQAGIAVEGIEAKRDEADSFLKDMTAETTHDDPDKANKVVETVQQNPAASLIDRAVADAISLQQQGKAKEAIEKWRSIANVVEGADSQLQARAWLSVGYLHGEKADWTAAIDALDKAIELYPDYLCPPRQPQQPERVRVWRHRQRRQEPRLRRLGAGLLQSGIRTGPGLGRAGLGSGLGS